MNTDIITIPPPRMGWDDRLRCDKDCPFMSLDSADGDGLHFYCAAEWDMHGGPGRACPGVGRYRLVRVEEP